MQKHLRGLFTLLLIAGTAHVATAQGNVKSIPNSQKYKNTGVKPATGRSGSATLEARVLIAKDSSMLLEASTSGVEAATHPGTITKMQVKIGPDFTQNHNGLNAGGFWSHTLPAATHRASIQLQGNIKGIDPKRTDVVTVTTPALLRPDIAVDSVSGIAQQKPGVPVTFTASVSEKNGDVGATANCVLSVDGAEVDSAAGIWIDAAGNVACEFTRIFANPGTYAISVAATEVKPGDWDTANNSAATSIVIVNPDKPIKNGFMAAYQESYSNRYYQRRSGGYYCYYYYYYCDSGYDNTYSNQRSIAYMHGWNQGRSAQMQRLDVTLSGNGVVQHDVSLTPTHAWSNDYGYYSEHCANYYNEYWDGSRYVRSGDWAQMCSGGYAGDPGNGWTNYHYQRVTGAVTYYGNSWYCRYWGCNSYTWNGQDAWGSGNLGWTAGTVVRLKLNFVDASGLNHPADRSVTLVDRSPQVNYYYANSWNDYWYGIVSWFHQGWGAYYQAHTSWND